MHRSLHVSLRLHDPLKSEIKIWNCQNLDLDAKGWCHLDYSQTRNDVINQVVSHNVLWNDLELSHNFVVVLFSLQTRCRKPLWLPLPLWVRGILPPPSSPGQVSNLLENLSIWAQETSPILKSLFLCNNNKKMVVVVVAEVGGTHTLHLSRPKIRIISRKMPMWIPRTAPG